MLNITAEQVGMRSGLVVAGVNSIGIRLFVFVVNIAGFILFGIM